ncbi:MAG: response regulator [Bryobacterales bacterium]|nr:response regulator [Bryobacterales bacterium]
MVEPTQQSIATDSPQPLIVAVLEDLFFGIKISEAAKKAGARLVITKTAEAFWARVAHQPALIVFDLTCQSLDPLELLRTLGASPHAGVATLGYLPHVQEHLRQQAIQAGCQRVMPRSAFSGQVDALVRDALAAAAQPAPR